MDRTTGQRSVLAALGGLAGGSLYLLEKLLNQNLLPDRAALALTAFAATFFVAVLALTGPLALRRAALGAAALGLAVALLLSWAGRRYATVDAMFVVPVPALAAVVLALMPLPFVIAIFGGRGWRDYPTLFTASWTIVVRYVAAWLFVAVVWAVILLSDTLLRLVGLTLVQDVLDVPVVPWLISGGALGLALAVVTELADLVSPYLLLRLLRLLIPVVTLVLVVFLAALPLRGLSGLFGTLSAAGTLLAMAVVAATLVTTAIDQSDAEAVGNALTRRSAQALALLLALPAGLAVYAVALRVQQYGWTPVRVVAALVALLAVGYGLIYALAVLRGAGWMARIRQGNVTMALAVMALAALLLTPVLNPERIAAQSQLARYLNGRTPAQALDVAAFADWGLAGAGALATLQAMAGQPGQQALAQRLAEAGRSIAPAAQQTAARLALLRNAMPLRPAAATATRDALLVALLPEELSDWLAACQTRLPDSTAPGCVMVVADFWPGRGGDEAIVVLRSTEGFVRYEGLAMIDGVARRVQVGTATGGWPDSTADPNLIAMLQATVPQVAPVAANQLLTGGVGLVLQP